MDRLVELTKQVFREESVLPGLSISERAKRFSIRKQPSDKAVAIDLRCYQPWPQHRKRADGLFIYAPFKSRDLLIIIVELKGGDKEHAIDQLSDTALVLCAQSESALQPHGSLLADFLRSKRSSGHAEVVLGIVLAKRSLPQKLREKKVARVHRGLKIKAISAQTKEANLEELRAWMK